MVPSSDDLDLLPVSARAAVFSRSSIAPACHYFHFSTSVVDKPGAFSYAMLKSPSASGRDSLQEVRPFVMI